MNIHDFFSDTHYFESGPDSFETSIVYELQVYCGI